MRVPLAPLRCDHKHTTIVAAGAVKTRRSAAVQRLADRPSSTQHQTSRRAEDKIMPAPADLRSGQAMAAVSSMVTAAATA
eukprot:COSAG01_NODE_61552_length_289_cov_0.521053_1_plen_79_part_10